MIEMREIPGFPNYFAGSDGEIYSKNYKKTYVPDEPRKLAYGRQKSGYHIVNLTSPDGKHNMRRIHCLICEAYHGPRLKGMQCSHLNDDKENNRPENLKWETDSENKRRKYLNNGGDRGIKNSRASFTEFDIRLIRMYLSGGIKHQDIANVMKCSRTSISRIHNNKRYVEVA